LSLSVLRNHTCDVWRETEGLNADGTRDTPTWARIADGVACRFQTGQSAKGPAGGFIVAESDQLDTLDQIHFELTADLQNGDVLVQTTGPDAGEYWTVRGDPKKQNTLIPKLSVRASRAMDVSPTISGAYA
jgi:hypothetical protein